MISVAMTTYNGEQFVKKQIDSVLNQTLPPDELIICDDCSKDHTADIIKEIIENNQTGVKIRFIENTENKGYVRNFYQAIRETNGDYIFLADQDDIWHEDKFEKMISVIDKYQCKAVCSNFRLIDQDDTPIEDRSQFRVNPFVNRVQKKYANIEFKHLIYGNIAQGCTYCFTKDVREAYLKLDSDTIIHDLQIMFIATSLGRVLFYNEELIDYRIHSSNAVGFNKTSEKRKLGLKKPGRKPFMVQFLDELDMVVPVKHKWFYELLYYLRIPHFYAVFRKQ